MSLTQFRIDKTNEVFKYDNSLNTIIMPDGSHFGKPTLSEATEPTFHKVNNPTTIKIILGHACNYSCSYCVQKDIGNPSERPKNIMTKDFIRRIEKNLLVDNIKRIELWGGETFLYWNDIMEIMKAFDREGLEWYLPTNGTILKLKHAEFFHDLKSKICIGISHDGPGHKTLRGPEFLDRKVSELRALNAVGVNYSFNAVLSTTNFDLFAINDYFLRFQDKYGLNHNPVLFEIGRTYETGACATESHVITKEQVPEYRDILKRYLRRHIQEYKTREKWHVGMLLPTNLFHMTGGVLDYAKSIAYQHPIHTYSNCGADQPGLITFDLNGNMRVCQNVNEDYVYGNIETVAKSNIAKVDFNKKDFCKDCAVLRLCNQSCPIDLPFETFLINHTIENVHFGEIQLAAFELLFDSNVTKLG